MTLPQMSGSPVVTDGGLETDLIYHHGADLPDFASFPLVEDEKGAALLREYYEGYVDIAAPGRVSPYSWRRRPGARAPTGAPGWATRRPTSTGSTAGRCGCCRRSAMSRD